MKHLGPTITRRTFLAGTSAALAAAAGAKHAGASSLQVNMPAQPLRLHFAQPASRWPDGLPVGNGRLGAVVFGEPALDRLQLNEESIWDGEPNRDRINPKAAAAMPRIRELLFAGNVVEAEALALSDVLSLPRRMPCYQTLGDLHLDFSAMGLTPGGAVEEYRRELDLDSAIATVSFRHNGVSYRREIFISAPEQIMVVRLTADQPGKLSVLLSLDRPHSFVVERAGDTRLALRGQALPVNDNPGLPVKEHQTGVRFYAELQARAEGGKVEFVESNGAPALKIANTNAITLLLDCATSYRYPAHAGKSAGTDADVLVGDPEAMRTAVRRNLSRAAAMSYDNLRARHTEDHQRYFRRVHFDLGPDPRADVPTDVRVKEIKVGGDDPHLQPLYFHYGRYMLISSSRPGTLAANLQGIWNESVDPPWGSKYTVNINTEMNYWFAEAANLSDCHLPMFDLLAATRPQATRCATEIYGAHGTVVHHNTDMWGDANPIDTLGGGVWPMGGNWLSLHLWNHYRFSGDRRFLLEHAYPTLRDNAVFLLDYMVRDPKTSHRITGPSCSPENAYIGPDGKPHHLCMAPTMDTAIVRSVFARLLESAAVLGNEGTVQADRPLLDRVREAWSELPPYKIAPDGRLQEWQVDYREAEPGHRHISHLFGLFPEDQITPDGTPELAHAARLVLDKRLAAGSGSTGWSRAWIVNCMARLRDGEAAYSNLVELFRHCTRPNLFDVCGMKDNSPFQIDGNLGAPNGIVEMLLQSQGETPLLPAGLKPGEPVSLRLLPAVPKAWADGSFRGLRARGGVQVDCEWSGGRIRHAVLQADHTTTVRLLPPAGVNTMHVRGGRVSTLSGAGQTSFQMELHPGRRYELDFA